jgi:hypothetical protein
MTDMTAFEARFRDDLRAILDAREGPHPVWATSPAAARVAVVSPRWSRRGPTRLLAVAAVLALGGLGVLIAGQMQPDPVGAGCPTLEDYAAASPVPGNTDPPVRHGFAPDVSFPPVAPDAPATHGFLQPGSWAVLRDEKGPYLQIRLRDVRDCGRLPTVRSELYDEGTIFVATVDQQALRADRQLTWTGPNDLFLPGNPEAMYRGTGRVRGVPGTDHETLIGYPRVGYASSSTLVLDAPATGSATAVFNYLESGVPTVPTLGWILREGAPGPTPGPGSFPVPGASATTGLTPADEAATVILDEQGLAGTITVGRIDEVPGYPGYQPPAGMVAIEAFVQSGFWPVGVIPAIDNGTGSPTGTRWVATDTTGQTLANLGDDPGVMSGDRSGMPQFQMVPSEFPFGWLVIEAPATGPIRLALLVDGEEVYATMLRD